MIRKTHLLPNRVMKDCSIGRSKTPKRMVMRIKLRPWSNKCNKTHKWLLRLPWTDICNRIWQDRPFKHRTSILLWPNRVRQWWVTRWCSNKLWCSTKWWWPKDSLRWWVLECSTILTRTKECSPLWWCHNPWCTWILWWVVWIWCSLQWWCNHGLSSPWCKCLNQWCSNLQWCPVSNNHRCSLLWCNNQCRCNNPWVWCSSLDQWCLPCKINLWECNSPWWCSNNHRWWECLHQCNLWTWCSQWGCRTSKCQQRPLLQLINKWWVV